MKEIYTCVDQQGSGLTQRGLKEFLLILLVIAFMYPFSLGFDKIMLKK